VAQLARLMEKMVPCMTQPNVLGRRRRRRRCAKCTRDANQKAPPQNHRSSQARVPVSARRQAHKKARLSHRIDSNRFFGGLNGQRKLVLMNRVGACPGHFCGRSRDSCGRSVPTANLTLRVTLGGLGVIAPCVTFGDSESFALCVTLGDSESLRCA